MEKIEGESAALLHYYRSILTLPNEWYMLKLTGHAE